MLKIVIARRLVTMNAFCATRKGCRNYVSQGLKNEEASALDMHTQL